MLVQTSAQHIPGTTKGTEEEGGGGDEVVRLQKNFTAVFSLNRNEEIILQTSCKEQKKVKKK